MQVARSSRQAADRVGLVLLSCLIKSTERSLSASSGRSAADCSLAIICTIVSASQEVYASGQDECRPEDVPQQGVHHHPVHTKLPSTAAAWTGTQPLAGRGHELLDIAVRSAAACAQQQGSMSSTGPDDWAQGDAEMHGSGNGLQQSLSPSYPMHELEVSKAGCQASPSNVCVARLNHRSRGCDSRYVPYFICTRGPTCHCSGLTAHTVMLCLQIVASLLSFPAATPSLSAELQQTALVAHLLAFAPDSALSARPASAAPQQQQRALRQQAAAAPQQPQPQVPPAQPAAAAPQQQLQPAAAQDQSIVDATTLSVLQGCNLQHGLILKAALAEKEAQMLREQLAVRLAASRQSCRPAAAHSPTGARRRRSEAHCMALRVGPGAQLRPGGLCRQHLPAGLGACGCL